MNGLHPKCSPSRAQLEEGDVREQCWQPISLGWSLQELFQCFRLKSAWPGLPSVLHVPAPLPSGAEKAVLKGSLDFLTQLACFGSQLAMGQGYATVPHGVGAAHGAPWLLQQICSSGAQIWHYSFKNRPDMRPAGAPSAHRGIADLQDKLRK